MTNGSIIIGYDFSEGNNRKALVVMQYDKNGKMKAVNAFYDEEGIDIYNKLTSKKEEERNG